MNSKVTNARCKEIIEHTTTVAFPKMDMEFKDKYFDVLIPTLGSIFYMELLLILPFTFEQP